MKLFQPMADIRQLFESDEVRSLQKCFHLRDELVVRKAFTGD